MGQRELQKVNQKQWHVILARLNQKSELEKIASAAFLLNRTNIPLYQFTELESNHDDWRQRLHVSAPFFASVKRNPAARQERKIKWRS